MNMLIFIINFLLLLAVWRFIFKPSIVNLLRDRLFELRDNLRDEFIDDLENIDYLNTRSMINHHIRFVETQSIMKVIITSRLLSKNRKISKYIDSLSPKIEDEKCKVSMEQANRTLKSCLIHTSIPFITIFYGLMFLALIIVLTESLVKSVVKRKSVNRRSVKVHYHRQYNRKIDNTLPNEAISYPMNYQECHA